MNRRTLLKSMALGAGASFGSGLFPDVTRAATTKGTPKRVIFFMQNQGFAPSTAIPAGMKNSGSLAKAKLPEPIEALEPFKERMHIINGWLLNHYDDADDTTRGRIR